MTHPSALDAEAALLEVANEVGQEYRITLVQPGTLDEAAYPPVAGAERRKGIVAIRLGYTHRDRAGTNIQEGDLRFLVTAASGAIPAQDDHIEAGGERYSVVSVRKVSPAGEDILYEVQARG